ncbi:TPA: hypothetical protein EYP44_03740, partial [Candidatus Bathyarchaeota archaeon]|nr:hypothetical protein [Candidatus Bathyarchaeota archaeon]
MGLLSLLAVSLLVGSFAGPARSDTPYKGGRRSPVSLYLEPLLERLYIPEYSAFREVEDPIYDRNDYWFWTGDNAKILLLLLMDYERYGYLADKIASFVESMYRDFLFLKKKADMSIRVQSDRPEEFRVSNNLVLLHGNLTSDGVYLVYEGRPVIDEVALFSGAYVSYNRTYHQVRGHVTSTSIDVEGRPDRPDKVVLTIGFGTPQGIRGTLQYIVRGRSPIVDVVLTVVNDGAEAVFDVKGAIVLDQLSELASFDHFYSPATGEVPIGEAPQRLATMSGSDAWWVIYRKYSLYESEAIWMSCPNHSNVVKIWNEGSSSEAHRLTIEYEGPSRFMPGERWVVTQEVLAMNGLNWVDIDRYDMREFDLVDVDPSFDFDWGLNVYALAEYFKRTGSKGEAVWEMIANFHRIALSSSRVRSRSLAFLIEACLTMYEATRHPLSLEMAEDLIGLMMARYIGYNPDGKMIARLHAEGGGGYTDVQAEVAKAFYRLYEATGDGAYLEYANQLFDAFYIDDNGLVSVRQICGLERPGKWSLHHGYVLDAGLLIRPESHITMQSLSFLLSLTREDFTIPNKKVGGVLNSEEHPHAVLRYGDYLDRFLGTPVVFKRLVSANVTSVVPDASAMSLAINLTGPSREAQL